MLSPLYWSVVSGHALRQNYCSTTMSNNSTSALVQEQVENGKNKNVVQCQRCPSTILSPGIAEYKQVEFPLPHMKQKREDTSDTFEESIHDYWLVEDMYSFDNVGYSNTVGNVKYLTCADCEIGPIGWFDVASKTSYVALSRVSHTSR